MKYGFHNIVLDASKSFSHSIKIIYAFQCEFFYVTNLLKISSDVQKGAKKSLVTVFNL